MGSDGSEEGGGFGFGIVASKGSPAPGGLDGEPRRGGAVEDLRERPGSPSLLPCNRRQVNCRKFDSLSALNRIVRGHCSRHPRGLEEQIAPELG